MTQVLEDISKLKEMQRAAAQSLNEAESPGDETLMKKKSSIMILEDEGEEGKSQTSSRKESSDDDYMELYVQKQVKERCEPIEIELA